MKKHKLQSALISGISGVILMGWVTFNAQLAIASNQIQFPPKELAADQCPYIFESINSTVITLNPTEEFHSIYKISYMW